jgi:hypothetical protein
VIERVGPSGSGSRTCSAGDAFTLDGAPLVTCSALGRTHCTKEQSFTRIRYDASADRWDVGDKDGTSFRLDEAARHRVEEEPAASERRGFWITA